MTTTDDTPRGAPAGRPAEAYVSREVCDASRLEQREANTRTWQELRSLRRVVILLVVGGQLFAGGLNVAGFAYWIDRHAAHPHASTLEMIADARAETREDLRDLRREIRDLAVLVLQRAPAERNAPEPEEGVRP
ncbi:MAG: hypothetical protein ISS74_06930 [Planctomycetes bacterium]|nr:hypothetical protein [Planctomycetota bacterium]